MRPELSAATINFFSPIALRRNEQENVERVGQRQNGEKPIVTLMRISRTILFRHLAMERSQIAKACRGNIVSRTAVRFSLFRVRNNETIRIYTQTMGQREQQRGRKK